MAEDAYDARSINGIPVTGGHEIIREHTNECMSSLQWLIRMDRVEENIRKVLDGRALDNCQDLCDFTLEEQNEAT
ncbi:hypothetical protein L9F63_001595, partial [Diploptera punctata]